MSRLLQKRLLMSFFIILVSIIYGFGNINFSSKQKTTTLDLLNLTQFSRITRDEIFAYAPFVNYISNGHFPLKDVYVFEYKDYPAPFLGETTPAVIFAILSKLTGSIEKTFIIGDFIFPPVVFLLFYGLCKIFIKNNFYALAVAFLTVIVRDFIAVIPYPTATLNYLAQPSNQLFSLYFSRAFHPQLTFIIFAASLLTIYKSIENPTQKINWVVLGILFGLLFYSYVFYWSYFLVFFALILTTHLIKKEILTLRGLVVSGVIAALIGFYYFLNMFQFYQLNFSQDFISRSALASLPIPATILRYIFIAVAFIAVMPKNRRVWVLFIFLLSGVLIAPFSRFVLDQDLETLHYLRRAVMPFSTIVFFIIIYQLIKNHQLIIKFTSYAILIITISAAINAQILAKENPIETYKLHKYQRETLGWLNANTKSGDVVGSLSLAFNLPIPAYTENKTYFPRSDRTIMPTSEEITRYIILSNILGITTQDQKARLENRDLLSYMFAYQAYSPKIGLDINSPIRFKTGQEIDELSSNRWEAETNNYKLDYVVVSPDEISSIKPNLKYLSPVTSIGEFIIFKSKIP